ncbi:type III pantothenate kinase [Rhodanobacter sp. PCA2]|uniref:type III pantothenate kinase n=1 Tax=Rhodanobacter sp. PCA2 TaxID=2006117 RepID=UPI0015E6EF2F|nr:type III pantothenate kinase [Rhodanobacter sp. PCA2]MBA2077346.1 type III pantothenate kinase [Rhodanobacter sp. PCA2]
MRLLLDLGNTRLKWALHDGDDLRCRGAVAWDDSVADALPKSWSALPRPAAVFGASVVDAAREQLVARSVATAYRRDVAWLRTPAAACGVRNAYAEPQRLGVDRFLAMVAARADGGAPCVLAGVGTALTLDALDADGRHLGGLIAPGPRLMQQSLLGATVQVRPTHEGAIVEAADNTTDAVASGCWLAAAALIERFATRMAPALGGAPALRLGGGDADALLPLLSLPAQLAHDSVLHGLAVWAAAQ